MDYESRIVDYKNKDPMICKFRNGSGFVVATVGMGTRIYGNNNTGNKKSDFKRNKNMFNLRLRDTVLYKYKVLLKFCKSLLIKILKKIILRMS